MPSNPSEKTFNNAVRAYQRLGYRYRHFDKDKPYERLVPRFVPSEALLPGTVIIDPVTDANAAEGEASIGYDQPESTS